IVQAEPGRGEASLAAVGRGRAVGGEAHLKLAVLDAARGLGVGGPGVSRVLESVPRVRVDLRTGERVEDDPSLARGGGEDEDETGQHAEGPCPKVHRRLPALI